MLTKIQCIESCRGKSSQYLYAVFSETGPSCDCIKTVPNGLTTYNPAECNNRNYKVSPRRNKLHNAAVMHYLYKKWGISKETFATKIVSQFD